MNAGTKSGRIRLVFAASVMAMSAVLAVAPAAHALDFKACMPQQCPKPPEPEKPLKACLKDCHPKPAGDFPLQTCTENCGGDALDDPTDGPKDSDPQPPADSDPAPKPQADPDPAPKPQAGEAPKPDVVPAAVKVAGPQKAAADPEASAFAPVGRRPNRFDQAGRFAAAAMGLGLVAVFARRRRQTSDDAAATPENM